jgi:hypothetical protein
VSAQHFAYVDARRGGSLFRSNGSSVDFFQMFQSPGQFLSHLDAPRRGSWFWQSFVREDAQFRRPIREGQT